MIPLAVCAMLSGVVLLCSGSVAIQLLAAVAGGDWRQANTIGNYEDRLLTGLILQVSIASMLSLVCPIGSILVLAVMLLTAALGLPGTVSFLKSRRDDGWKDP